MEDLAIRWLRLAGFDLYTRKQDGEQFGFSVAGGRIQGHVDGVIAKTVLQYLGAQRKADDAHLLQVKRGKDAISVWQAFRLGQEPDLFIKADRVGMQAGLFCNLAGLVRLHDGCLCFFSV